YPRLSPGQTPMVDLTASVPLVPSNGFVEFCEGIVSDAPNTSAGAYQCANVPVTPAPTSSKPGIFRSGFLWLLDVDGNQQLNVPPDRVFPYGGITGDIPINGDWNGDGRSKVGIYRNGLFILDSNGNGVFDAADAVFNLGLGVQAGDVPVVGDWNGDG